MNFQDFGINFELRKRTEEEIERIETESKIKKCKRDLKKLEKSAFDRLSPFSDNEIAPNVEIGPVKPKKPVSTVKFSIKNILNLDDAEDLVNGPPVIELGADKNEGVLHGGSVPPVSQLSQMPPQAFAHSYPTPSYLGMYSHSIPNMQNMYFNHFSQLPHFLNNKILH